MRLLFDDNISYLIIKKVSASFPDSMHVNRTGLSFPAADRAIWEYSKQEGLVIITFDEDFEDLYNLYGFPPKVIILRIGNSATKAIAKVLESKQPEINAFFASSTY